ncbi:MAG: hypothetical protein ABJP45_09250 [Cyclobacteriaceae bacterium]
MENEHLHLLIDEEIYVVESQGTSDKLQAESGQSIVDNQQSEKRPAESPQSALTEKTESIQTIRIAFIHSTDNQEELDLLTKIIGACNLNESNFKVVREDEQITFQKAVIFTGKANTYYQQTATEVGEIMYSKPLIELQTSKEEKSKLWSALQEFVKA